MNVTRRELFTSIATGGMAVAVGRAVSAATMTGIAHAEEPAKASPEAVGLLYDASICIGCKACVSACAEANDYAARYPRRSLFTRHPSDLNDHTRNIIKLYKPEDGSAFSYVKRQCMHCLDPACAAGCLFQGLHKDPRAASSPGTAEVHRLPLLHHHLPVSHSDVPVGWVQPESVPSANCAKSVWKKD